MTCPTPSEVREIDQDLEIVFIDDPTTAAPLACTEADGSVDLTILQMGAYQSLRLMRIAEFTEPLPWTTSLYDWFIGTVRRMEFNPNTEYSYATSDHKIVIKSSVDPRYLDPGADQSRLLDQGASLPAWVLSYLWERENWRMGDSTVAWIQLFVHEARHTEGIPHTCGDGRDETFQEMGAWAYAWLTLQWFSEKFQPEEYFDSDQRRNMDLARSNMSEVFCDGSSPG